MTSTSSHPQIVLASTSPFRKMLLEKLGVPFETAKPEVDETPQTNETVAEMVSRLSLAKAKAIAPSYPNALIIASDQSASFQDRPIGKPHHYENAVKQLRQFSGQTITFWTGLVVLDTRHNTSQQTLDETRVTFRTLTETDIHNYLVLEEPYQCAGSFKSEGLGITLFESIEGKDPNALIGLPLIDLTHFLRQCGLQLPYLPD